MYNLFTNYASRYLNKSFQDESLQNEPIDPDVSAFVLNLLNRTQNETDIKKECNFSQKVSRAEKIVEKLKKMPSSSVSYYKQTLKIQKNTPFRRVYGLSTIVDQRNALKRKSDNDMWPVNIKTLKTSNETQEKPNLDSFDYEVEALDECIFVDQSEISEISNSYHTSSYDSSAPVYVSQQPNTILEVSDKSTSSKSNISQNIKLPKGITMKKVEPKIIVKTSLQEILKKTKKNESSSKSASLSDHSILDVPSIDSSFDENRGPLNSPQSLQLPFDYDSAATHRALVPKKLSFSLDEPGEVLEEKPPSWFTKFVERYEANSKKVNEELEKINQMLKSLPQKVLVSPRVTQIKRPR